MTAYKRKWKYTPPVNKGKTMTQKGMLFRLLAVILGMCLVVSHPVIGFGILGLATTFAFITKETVFHHGSN